MRKIGHAKAEELFQKGARFLKEEMDVFRQSLLRNRGDFDEEDRIRYQQRLDRLKLKLQQQPDPLDIAT